MPDFSRDDASIAYDYFGDGPPLVLLPGGGAPRQSWTPIALRLSEAGYCVVTMDNRGSGPSTLPSSPFTVTELANDVVALLDELELDQASLVGHSLGGVVAAEVALGHPERVDAVALLGSPRMGHLNQAWCAWLDVVLQPPTPIQMTVPVLLSVFPPHVLQQDAFVDVALEMVNAGPQPDPASVAAQARALLEWTRAWEGRSLAAVRAPTLIVSFEFDVHAPPELGRRTAEELPAATHVMIEGHGHGGVQSASSEVATVLLEFLSDHFGP
jgi:thioesterase CepJ